MKIPLILATLLAAGCCYHIKEDTRKPDNNLRLDRPRKEATPEVNECGEILGFSRDSNCGKNNQLQTQTPEQSKNYNAGPNHTYIPDQHLPNNNNHDTEGRCICVPYYNCNENSTINDDIQITDSKSVAQYGEFPWMVAVFKTNHTVNVQREEVSVFLCGGSLIHPQVVITGAHCVIGKNNFAVSVGEWETQMEYELYPTQDRKVIDVITHEEFNNKTLANNIALVILDSPVDMRNENVGLICLPEPEENVNGRDCVASGWGKEDFGHIDRYLVFLKKVEVLIVPREQCLEALHRTRLGQNFVLRPSFVCAGGIPSRETCKGDFGSALACPSKNNSHIYVQAGIVTWGIGCGTEIPAVYINVPSFVNWIQNKLKSKGISLE